jgi:hypothetical protein
VHCVGQQRSAFNIPLDRESGNSGLLSEHVASDLLNDGFGRRVGIQDLIVVLIVDVVTHADEFSSIVRAGQKNDSHAKDLRRRQALSVGRIGFKYEFVDTDGDRADEQRVELLVMFCRRGRADVGEFPF